jgi:hypothetical protein
MPHHRSVVVPIGCRLGTSRGPRFLRSDQSGRDQVDGIIGTRRVASAPQGGEGWASRTRSTSWALRTSARRPGKGTLGIKRITIAKRMRTKLKEVNDQLKRGRHQPIPVQGRWLRSVVAGHLAYYAVPGNTDAVSAFQIPCDPALVGGAAAPQPARPDQLGPDEPDRDPMATKSPCDATLSRGALGSQNLKAGAQCGSSHAGIRAGAARESGPYRDHAT